MATGNSSHSFAPFPQPIHSLGRFSGYRRCSDAANASANPPCYGGDRRSRREGCRPGGRRFRGSRLRSKIHPPQNKAHRKPLLRPAISSAIFFCFVFFVLCHSEVKMLDLICYDETKKGSPSGCPARSRTGHPLTKLVDWVRARLRSRSHKGGSYYPEVFCSEAVLRVQGR